MDLYEREYGTDWTALDKDEATERAYALGVAEALGQYNREEFEAVYEEMDTAYNRSIVELAFREGKKDAQELTPPHNDADLQAVWEELVEDGDGLEEDDLPFGGRNGIPGAIDRMDAIERPDPDEIDATDRPDFLDK